MRNFIRNCKGAATVFVTLLLIPSLLITGTGVDVARIYAARSLVRDANQLAANSALASYEALLKDLYGLYAVMDEDENLSDMLKTYIKASLYGEEVTEAKLGEYRLLLGSHGETFEVECTDPIGRVNILRRQIEEYAKWRAPVAIFNNLMALIKDNGFGKLKEDAEVIEDKLEVDELYDEVAELYQEIYQRLRYNDLYGPIESTMYLEINTQLSNINNAFKDMQDARESWEDAEDEDEAEYYRQEFMDARDRITGYWRSSFNYQEGYAEKIEKIIERYQHTDFWTPDEDYYTLTDGTGHCLDSYADNIDELLPLCELADKKAVELRAKITELESKLGSCTPELKNGVQESLNKYKEIFQNPILPMVNKITSNKQYINDNVKRTINDLVYGSILSSNRPDLPNSMSLNQLKNLNYQIEDAGYDKLDNFADLSNYKYTAFQYFNSPRKMLRFAELGNNEQNLYNRLKQLFDNSSKNQDKNKKKDVDKAIDKMLADLKAGFTNDVEGAKNIPSNMFTILPSKAQSSLYAPIDSDFGEENPGSAKNARKSAKKGMKEVQDMFGDIGGLLSSAANKVLLLTYDVEMFSCYITGRGDNGEENVYTMGGYEMGTDINYLYQSEMEYLFNGKSSADSNLNSVTGLIYLTRFVFNYISTFNVDFVKTTLNTIETTMRLFVVTFPFATVTKELCRVLFAFVESGVDVYNLRNGRAVALLKDDKSWQTGPNLVSELAGKLGFSVTGHTPSDDEDKKGLFYSHYMTIFLLFVNGDDLAARTADLISLNMTNKKENVNAVEDSMRGKTLYPLNKAFTNFKVTTAIDLQFTFISLPYAKKVMNSPPKTFHIKQTDYRGY